MVVGSGDPGNRAQNRNLLFGKILRINVDGADPYTIPDGQSLCRQPDVRGRFGLGAVSGNLCVWIAQSVALELRSRSDGAGSVAWLMSGRTA